MKHRLAIVGWLVGGFWVLVAGLLGASGVSAAGQRAPTAGTVITVTTAVDDFTVDANCSLREAIQAANTNAAVDACPAGTGADTIRLPRVVYSLTLTGSETTSGTVNAVADLDILSSLTIEPVSCTGPACNQVPIIQAGAGWSHRLVQVTGPYAVTLSGLVLQGGNSTGAAGGGAVLNLGADLSLLGTNVYSSTAAHNGGGIDNESGSLTLSGGMLRGNTAGGYGGGLFNQSGTVTLNNTTVNSNTATYVAGLDLAGGKLSMTNGGLQGNTATHNAGGLRVQAQSAATLSFVTLRGNSAISDGVGALEVDASAIVTLTSVSVLSNGTGIGNDGRLTVSNSTFSDNTLGGALETSGQATIANSTFSSNTSIYNGGAIYVAGGLATLSNSTLSDNHAAGGGGALAAGNGATLSVLSSTVRSNTTAGDGGGVLLNGTSTTVNITSSAILSNTAVQFGGGIADDGELAVANSTVSGNTTNSNGGGIGVGFEANLSNVTIANNTADKTGAASQGGGGIAGSQVFAQNTLIAGNHDNQPSAKTPDCGVTDMTSYGYNLVQDPTGCHFTGTLTGNITGHPALLGALGNNGGPTWTQALLAGSPAIDSGNPVVGCDNLKTGLVLTTDQRGQPRPQGNACDIGAFESAFAVTRMFLYLPLVKK